MSERVTSQTIRDALTKLYPPQAYAVLFEVTDATGARQTRSADAVIMSCWPSRGLDLMGVEIKVSRSDWLSELKNPAKAEPIAQYCDRWWLVTGPGVVVDLSEIPNGWGWMEYAPASTDLAGKKTAAKLLVRKEAPKIEAKPPTRLFLASVLRNASRVSEKLIDDERRKVRAQVEGEVQASVESQVKRRSERADALFAQVKEFEDATGILIAEKATYGWMSGDGGALGRLVMALKDSRIAEKYGLIDSLSASLDGAVKKLAMVKAAFVDAGAGEAP